MSINAYKFRDMKTGRVNHILSNFIYEYNQAGKIIASWPDYYIAGKSSDVKFLNSLREEIRQHSIVAGTMFSYTANSLEGTITHYPESTVIAPNVISLLIPVYNNVHLDQVLESADGVTFMRAAFNTRDSPKELARTIEQLSGKSINKIKVWTLAEHERRPDFSKFPARFASSRGIFYLIGVHDLGCSHAVLGNPAGIALNTPVSGSNYAQKIQAILAEACLDCREKIRSQLESLIK